MEAILVPMWVFMAIIAIGLIASLMGMVYVLTRFYRSRSVGGAFMSMLASVVMYWLFFVSYSALTVVMGLNVEHVEEVRFEAERTTKIRHFTRDTAETLGVEGDIANLLVYKHLDMQASAEGTETYTVMEDTYGDGGCVSVSYDASDVRIYEDIDEAGEEPYIEVGDLMVGQRATWLCFGTEWDGAIGRETRIHVEPGSVLDAQ